MMLVADTCSVFVRQLFLSSQALIAVVYVARLCPGFDVAMNDFLGFSYFVTSMNEIMNIVITIQAFVTSTDEL